MVRFIGIRHRVKRTAEGEARPTMVAIKYGDSVQCYELEDETAELDFVLGFFPTSFRDIKPYDNISALKPHHIKWRKLRDGDNFDLELFVKHLRQQGKVTEVAVKLPASYDGLQAGDTVAMTLGGSGDRLAYALSRRGEEIGANVFRIPPAKLKELRGESSKEDDHKFLAELIENKKDLFSQVSPRDRELIRLREAFESRKDAQKDRIACEQRLRQRFIGRIFLSEEGKYPEGSIEDEYDRARASDTILQSLLREEKAREDELKKIVHSLEVWKNIFEPIKGCGEIIAAGIVASIGDVRRFSTDSKLKAYCGVHVLLDGRIPRKRAGELANWNAQARQSLYLLGDQFNRRPDSEWGRRLREYKVKFRAKHPPIVENGKKKYGDGHIHKMATWRTLTKFVERLHRDWTRMENI